MYRYKLMAKNTLQVIADFGETVIDATIASVKATVRLPWAIKQAIDDARDSAKVDAELEAALIDKTFLDRATKND